MSAEADNGHTQILTSNTDVSSQPVHSQDIVMPSGEEPLIAQIHDTKLPDTEDDAKVPSSSVAHESIEDSLDPARVTSQVEPLRKEIEEEHNASAAIDVPHIEPHSAYAGVSTNSDSPMNDTGLEVPQESPTNATISHEEHIPKEHDSKPEISIINESTDNISTGTTEIVTSSPTPENESIPNDPLVSVEPSSLKGMNEAPPILIVVPSPFDEDPNATDKRSSSAPELSPSHEQHLVHRPVMIKFDSAVAEDGHSERAETPGTSVADSMELQRVVEEDQPTPIYIEEPVAEQKLAQPTTSDVKPIDIAGSSLDVKPASLAEESFTPRPPMAAIIHQNENERTPVNQLSIISAEKAQMAASTEVLPPTTPQHTLSTPSVTTVSSGGYSEEPITIEESQRLTPRLDQENEEGMLRSRLEIGLDAPIMFNVSPQGLERSTSEVAVPPDTPHIEEATEPVEESPLASGGNGDVSEAHSTVFPIVEEVVAPTHGKVIEKTEESSKPIEDPSTSAVPVPGHQEEPSRIPINDVDAFAEIQGQTPLSPIGDWDDNVKTPIATRRPILEAESHPPLAEVLDTNDLHEADSTPSKSNAILPIPELIEKAAHLDVSTGLLRSVSIVPIPPTSPRSEFDPDETITEPTIDSVNNKPSREGSTNSYGQATDIPTVAIIPSESPGSDFVEDARSERSVGTSVAPIAPNSPRFISPMPTPSLDSTGFASLEQFGSSTSTAGESSTQPLTEAAVGSLPVAGDNVSELAPELRDALDTSFMQSYNYSEANAPATAPVERSGRLPLPTVSEDTQERTGSLSRPIRPRHTSSPSWSINRTSGWFHSVPSSNIPGRPSLEIVEGEFSRPPNGKYPPASAGVAGSGSRPGDDPRCVIF